MQSSTGDSKTHEGNRTSIRWYTSIGIGPTADCPKKLTHIMNDPLSAQGTSQTKATAPEKMMPVDKAQKMRGCLRWAEQQKIKMEDSSRFVDECLAGKAK